MVARAGQTAEDQRSQPAALGETNNLLYVSHQDKGTKIGPPAPAEMDYPDEASLANRYRLF
ncbi:hypothetical protein HNQ77_003346 [Silvibacterium bohemicum]|uniref:Uncharacterized protein n=1 Tax=Silvibacterium bohemicum TaxID=1577686 RepID=A0A841K430_9BACT|nr:hypothetical protein [Silvibacterium bohemicum]